MSEMSLSEKMQKTLNRLCKWRTVFAGWQLGTRLKEDPECAALRDHRELTLLLRAEVTALTALLLEKNTFTLEGYQRELIREAEQMDQDLARRFPGFTSSDEGMKMNLEKAKETMKNWRP